MRLIEQQQKFYLFVCCHLYSTLYLMVNYAYYYQICLITFIHITAGAQYAYSKIRYSYTVATLEMILYYQ